MEIEAKFRVCDREVFAALLRLSRLGPFSLCPSPSIEHQRNTYFDTPDRLLTTKGYTLRIRDLGARRIAALKRSLRKEGGVSEREEWEVEIGTTDHPLTWPVSAARRYALGLLGLSPLEPLLTVVTRRHSIAVARDSQPVAELDLDEGFIMAGGRIVGFRELEVELKGAGQRADLDALMALLQARFVLEVEPFSKKARGLMLAAQVAAEHDARQELALGAYAVL